jgi:hypothetical protein
VGTILPLGPVNQCVDRQVGEPLALAVYPGPHRMYSLTVRM